VTSGQEALPAPLAGLAGRFGLPTFLEARAQVEWLRLMGDPIWRRPEIPGAQPRPVLLIPGFMASKRSMEPMRRWLCRLGFNAEVALIGLNAWSSAQMIEVVVDRIRQLAAESGHRAIVIGHSRGGQHGTVAAVRAPEAVQALLTLGSPLRVAHTEYFLTRVPVTLLKAVGRFVATEADRAAEARYEADLLGPFPADVRRISVWSKSDGIVDWRVSMIRDAKNVEVRGSHIGLAVNRHVYAEIASALEDLAAAASERGAAQRGTQ